MARGEAIRWRSQIVRVPVLAENECGQNRSGERVAWTSMSGGRDCPASGSRAAPDSRKDRHAVPARAAPRQPPEASAMQNMPGRDSRMLAARDCCSPASRSKVAVRTAACRWLARKLGPDTPASNASCAWPIHSSAMLCPRLCPRLCLSLLRGSFMPRFCGARGVGVMSQNRCIRGVLRCRRRDGAYTRGHVNDGTR